MGADRAAATDLPYLGVADLRAARVFAGSRAAGPRALVPDEDDAGWFAGRQAWTTLLVRQTLEWAATSVPFYRSRGLAPEAFQTLSDLRRYPAVSKAEIVADPRRFLSERTPPESFHCTSGTTGRRLIVYGNTQEQDAAEALLALRAPRGGGPEIALRLFPNTLRLFAPPARGHPDVYNLVINFSLNQTHHQWFDNSDHLIEILGDEYLLGDGQPRRVGSIHATPPYLLEFVTRQLVARGVDPLRFGVRAIGLSGGFTTRRVRRIVEQQWHATCHTSYSCTEVKGEAQERIGAPGDYLPGPAMHCEIVAPDTGEPVADGEAGEVLLTSLAPFQTVMPFLRYRTGDLAQRIALPDHPGEQPFLVRPIGRAAHCVKVADGVYVGTRDVLDAVADIDAVPQFPYPRYQLLLERGPSGRGTVVLRIETVDVPQRDRPALERSIADALCGEWRARTPGASEIAVDFRVDAVGKGDLERYIKLYPDR